MLSCQGEEGDRIAATAIADPDRFVLKPQREGGGMSWALELWAGLGPWGVPLWFGVCLGQAGALCQLLVLC